MKRPKLILKKPPIPVKKPKVKAKPKAKSGKEPAKPRITGDKSIQVRAATSQATFGRAMIKLRKARKDGDIDPAYQKEIYNQMLISTSRLVGIAEKAIIKSPENTRHVYSYNNLVSQCREIMHDMSVLNSTDGQADKILTMLKSTMGNIVQQMVDLMALYKAELVSNVSPKEQKQVKDKFDLILRKTAGLLQENYKGLSAQIIDFYVVKR